MGSEMCIRDSPAEAPEADPAATHPADAVVAVLAATLHAEAEVPAAIHLDVVAGVPAAAILPATEVSGPNLPGADIRLVHLARHTIAAAGLHIHLRSRHHPDTGLGLGIPRRLELGS